jgi:rod shape-determining protein MreC
MAEILFRRRPLSLLATIIVAQILLLAFQIKRDPNVRLIRYWTAEIITPGERAGTWMVSKIAGVWDGYIALHSMHAENESLRAEVGQLRLRNRELESQALEGERLDVLLKFRESHPEAPMLAAQVIGGSADPSSHVVFINRGEHDHVRRDQAVITPNGIVGKIVEVLPYTSQVLLLNDKDSGVGALLEDTRTQGVVNGSGSPEPVMDYVTNEEKIHPGEVILTSGEDRIFPKGLLIGTVASATPGSPFQNIHVRTAARLDRLEDVLVLLTRQDLTPPKGNETAEEEGKPGVVYADPLVPDKPHLTSATPVTAPSHPPAAPATAPEESPKPPAPVH